MFLSALAAGLCGSAIAAEPVHFEWFEYSGRDATFSAPLPAGNFHNPILADPATAREYVDREWAGQNIADRYEWLFRYDATKVTIP